MKHILVIIILFTCLSGIGQSPFEKPCGTWVKDKDTSYSWSPIDTIGNKKILNNIRLWVYDKERFRESFQTKAVWCPCGCPDDEVYFQDRVCSITGIRQRRMRVVTYKYIEPIKTPYEKTIDSLKTKP